MNETLDRMGFLCYICRRKPHKKPKQKKSMNENSGEIILYQPDNIIRLEVRMQEETVWLTQAQMGQLFDCSTDNISLHLKNLYAEGEIESKATSEEISVEGDRHHYQRKRYCVWRTRRAAAPRQTYKTSCKQNLRLRTDRCAFVFIELQFPSPVTPNPEFRFATDGLLQ